MKEKAPVWFTIVAVLALIWNLMGVMAFLGQLFMPPEMMEALPAEQKDLMARTPVWVNLAFATAVFGGALGALFLLLKKRFALPLFILSFVGVVIQMYWNFFIGNSIEVYGPGEALMPAMILLFGLLLILLANKAKNKRWIV